MSTFSRYRARLCFVGGVVVGAFISVAVLRLIGFTLISQQDLDEKLQLITDLQDESHELTDDLFVYKGPDVVFDTSELP